MKVVVDLTPRARRRGAVPVPESTPVLYLSDGPSGAVKITVNDSLSLRRRRPAGARGMELYERIIPVATLDAWSRGEGEDADAGDWRYIGLQTRTPIELTPALNTRGDQACYVGRWVTARGRTSAKSHEVAIRPSFNPVSRVVMSRNDHRGIA